MGRINWERKITNLFSSKYTPRMNPDHGLDQNPPPTRIRTFRHPHRPRTGREGRRRKKGGGCIPVPSQRAPAAAQLLAYSSARAPAGARPQAPALAPARLVSGSAGMGGIQMGAVRRTWAVPSWGQLDLLRWDGCNGESRMRLEELFTSMGKRVQKFQNSNSSLAPSTNEPFTVPPSTTL